MTDDALPAEFSNDDQEFLASNGIAVSVQPEGVLVAGDDQAVAGYLARIKDLAGDAVQVTSIDKASVSSAAAVAGGLAGTAAQHGQFVRLSPESVKMMQAYRVLPGTGGYNRMTVVDASHKFRGQMQWQNVSMAPTRALGLQLLAVQIALQTAVQSVSDAVERVQGTVDKILVLAEASRIGDVVGNHAALSRIAQVHSETGALPTADWESIASLGPALEVGIERLREHAKRTVAGFDAQKPVQDRASYLKNAVEDKRLGETLQLLVIAEQSLYLWQKMRIERVRATEPEHLETVVNSARELLLGHFERDGDLLVQARGALASYAAIKPLEIVRWMSANDLKRDMTSLRQDLDDFANARGSQVAGWIEHEDPSVSDALAEVGNRAKAVGGAAVAIGGKAVDAGASGLGWVGRNLQKVSSKRGSTEGANPKTTIDDMK
ncbi:MULTISPECIES: hypothetical protein [unclassified Rhodococcus (in: high G+C Gram-positive bacteria)]|uniref:hypothetical protein n=1 Tax=unclassified Rhodococcus (in: high G+C Gram-positive bacteria) TaxID=192944 RepID=UPI0021C19F21|nr:MULTISPECIES: hypothetical protein [unclassified Rhodococcus (in: high G+C Gram-positive bacteria)]